MQEVLRVRSTKFGSATYGWGIALAAALAVAFVVVSPIVDQRTVSPVSAEHLLRSAMLATKAMPYSGTATVTYLGPDTTLLPDRVVMHHLITQWSASDTQHFRMEVKTVEPAIDSGSLTTIQDGSRLIQYDTRTETAGVRNDAPPIGDMLSFGDSAAPIPGMRLDQSIQQYLDSTQQDSESPGVRHFARILRKERLLGREVDVVKFAPVMQAIQCFPKNSNGMSCKALHFGEATVWIDDATHLILKYQADLASPHFTVRSFLYEVTSLVLGQGATQADLSPQLPMSALPITHPPIGTATRGILAGVPVPVPAGFLAAPAPPGLPKTSTKIETVTTAPLGAVAAINILYANAASTILPYARGGRFLTIEESVQAHGLPSALRTGTPAQAGTCQAWTGTSADGLHTLAFAHGTISVLLASDSLSAVDLVSYVAHSICA